MKNERHHAALVHFFSCYFNQDWMLEGAVSWKDVIAQFLADDGKEGATVLREALVCWREEAHLTGQKHIDFEFGCDFDSHSIGLNGVEWVSLIVEELDRLIGSEGVLSSFVNRQ